MAIDTAILAYEPIGANFYQADSTQKFRLGEIALGAHNSRWEYIVNSSASTQINQYETVGYNTDYKASAVASSGTSDAAKYRNIGWPQVSIPGGYYGWVARSASGGIGAKAAASVGANAQLYIGKNGTSAGVLTAASGTNTVKVFGAVLVTAISSSGTNTAELIANFPRFGAVS